MANTVHLSSVVRSLEVSNTGRCSREIIAEVILALFRIETVNRENFVPQMIEAAKKFGSFLGKGFYAPLQIWASKSGRPTPSYFCWPDYIRRRQERVDPWINQFQMPEALNYDAQARVPIVHEVTAWAGEKFEGGEIRIL